MKNRSKCTKIAKFVENNHLRLEKNENYKDHYYIFFAGRYFRCDYCLSVQLASFLVLTVEKIDMNTLKFSQKVVKSCWLILAFETTAKKSKSMMHHSI